MRVKKSTVINVKDYPENNTSVIMGSINLKELKEQPVVILAYSVNPVTEEKKYITSYVILNHTTNFMLYLPEGVYYLYAITDSNNDYIFDGNEITGVYGRPDKIVLKNNEIRNDINLNIGSSELNGIKLPEKFSVQYNYNSIEYTTYNGQIRKIYSEIFSSDNAKIGWWHPSLFMKAFGANIYLTANYDPSKIPVLFVHGAQGSPQDWAYFYVRLDKKKYQPLFFYYPAGLRLPLLSKLLYIKIKELEQKYRFKRLYLIAHSMGGLVTRSMLTTYCGDKEKLIKLYATFATPWSGFEFADAALKTAPYVLPSWIDVSSHSMFIKTLLDKNISSSIDYYLFFGKNDNTSKGRALDARAYSGAKGIFGFNADHNTILSEKEVFDKFNEILSN
ncbi:MAG: alpha/beta hydrolase [Spirochaetota bacterium]